MKLRVIILGLVAASAAAAETASLPTATPPVIPTVDESGQVPLDCDKRLGAYQFAKQRYEAKVKMGAQTWEDVANYHSTRADYLECVANGQFEAIKVERHARNEVIALLNASNARESQLNDEIVIAQETFAQCDKAPIPSDLAATTCGPETFVHTCAQNTVRRLFAKENTRGEGPRANLLRSILQQSLSRRVSLLQCVVDHVDPIETTSPSEAPAGAAPVAQKN
ncbi:MAG TPA: hypothetical protein VMG12_31145 [Polyangiaceae bacterium]|nr:hypothetical protein [Polyangiaceae bacterium]